MFFCLSKRNDDMCECCFSPTNTFNTNIKPRSSKFKRKKQELQYGGNLKIYAFCNTVILWQFHLQRIGCSIVYETQNSQQQVSCMFLQHLICPRRTPSEANKIPLASIDVHWPISHRHTMTHRSKTEIEKYV